MLLNMELQQELTEEAEVIREYVAGLIAEGKTYQQIFNE